MPAIVVTAVFMLGTTVDATAPASFGDTVWLSRSTRNKKMRVFIGVLLSAGAVMNLSQPIFVTSEPGVERVAESIPRQLHRCQLLHSGTTPRTWFKIVAEEKPNFRIARM